MTPNPIGWVLGHTGRAVCGHRDKTTVDTCPHLGLTLPASQMVQEQEVSVVQAAQSVLFDYASSGKITSKHNVSHGGETHSK